MNSLLRQEKALFNNLIKASNLLDFKKILPYLLEDREILYVKFGKDPVLEQPGDGTQTCRIPLTYQFELFTNQVCETIRDQAQGKCILFDSLSELVDIWATDLMVLNFYTVISDIVSKVRARAFYYLDRKSVSTNIANRIRDRSQMVADIYSDITSLYLRAEKIEGVSDQKLFRPWLFRDMEGFTLLEDGVKISRFQRVMNQGFFGNIDTAKGSWDRFFDSVRMKYMNGLDVTEDCGRICQIMMSRDDRIQKIIKEHFTPEDYFFVKEHMIGTGLIGGKACGMLAARKIIENKRPDIYGRLEPHTSFYIGSDVFYTYIIDNGLWELKAKQREPGEYFTAAEKLSDGLMQGTFSEALEHELRRLLGYYGSTPLIVRSSSILEDGFDNGFVGKYESVFCGGQGSVEDRLAEIEQAMRIVYASTVNPSALDYRQSRGLSGANEQMALLIQLVSGSHYGNYYYPCAAGVGYSYSAYRFLESLDPDAGMLRLVMGLGTAAVDRSEGSYPRLVSLDKPEVTAFHSKADHHRYSQRNVDLIDKETGKLTSVLATKVLGSLPAYLKKILFTHDLEAEMQFLNRGQRREIMFITCSGLTGNHRLMGDMKDIMQSIQKEYGQPVDIEFTINVAEDQEYIINILQCRPLQVFKDEKGLDMPEDIPEDSVILDIKNSSMGLSGRIPVDAVLYVDPIAYYEMPYQKKHQVAKVINRVNADFRKAGQKLILMVPGRVGTTSPELGVPVVFADISSFSAIIEMAEQKAGYNPELSYGSHMFQDFVENNTLYGAVFNDHRTLLCRPERITNLPNEIGRYTSGMEEVREIAGLYRTDRRGLTIWHSLYDGRLMMAVNEKGGVQG